jgi:hypothetical protein
MASLRESIAFAKLMGLHLESTYSLFSPQEEQLMRRVFWLLFVTERYCADNQDYLK